jgi:predicted nucleic acid-binding protein
MIIVDASVFIDFLRAKHTSQTNWLNQETQPYRAGITSLGLCEVLQGTKTEAHFVKVQSILANYEFFELGSRELAVASANNFRVLREIGFTIRNTIDCIIATFCIEEDHLLLHNDRDFDPFESHLGLKVFRPLDSMLH